MSHAWWRDSDYELFGRLTKEVAVLRADLDVAESRKSQVIHDLAARAEKAEAERDALRAHVEGQASDIHHLMNKAMDFSDESKVLRAQVEAARSAAARIVDGMYTAGARYAAADILAAMDGAKP